MDKAEYIRKRKEILMRQAQIFKEKPEIGRYVKVKKIALWVLAAIIGFHGGVEVWLLFLMPGFSGYDVGREIIKALFLIAMLYVLLNLRGSWRRILILYAYAALNLGMLIQYREGIMDVIVNHKYMSMPIGPLYVAMILMEALLPIMLLVFALYLTVPLKHQVIADVVANMYKEDMEELRDAAG